VLTISHGNGLEFARHEEISAVPEAAGYFCKPHSSWEKGGVENFIGLVRQYFPKGSDLSAVYQPRLDEVEAQLIPESEVVSVAQRILTADCSDFTEGRPHQTVSEPACTRSWKSVYICGICGSIAVFGIHARPRDIPGCKSPVHCTSKLAA
jgi:hypothetical protein